VSGMTEHWPRVGPQEEHLTYFFMKPTLYRKASSKADVKVWMLEVMQANPGHDFYVGCHDQAMEKNVVQVIIEDPYTFRRWVTRPDQFHILLWLNDSTICLNWRGFLEPLRDELGFKKAVPKMKIAKSKGQTRNHNKYEHFNFSIFEGSFRWLLHVFGGERIASPFAFLHEVQTYMRPHACKPSVTFL